MKTKTQLSRDSQLLSVLSLVDDFEDFVFFGCIYELVYVVVTCNTCTFL